MAVNETTLLRRSQLVREPDSNATVAQRVKYLIVRMRKTQRQFASMLGIDGPNLSRILNGHTPFSDAMINRIVVNLGVSKQWLLTGEDIPFPKNSGQEYNLIDEPGDARVLNQQPGGAPVYDIDVTAGYTELSAQFTDDRIIGWLQLPKLREDNVIVKVSGNSMLPEIIDGGYISIRPIRLDSPIYWGQTYLIIMEDYRMVKVIRRHKDADKVILHSLNPDYDDMDINRSDIKALYIVDAVLNLKIIS